MTALSRTEHQEAVRLRSWILKTRPNLDDYFAHIGNERKCSVVQGAKLKAVGVKRGFPDFMLLLPSRGYHGLFIELKRSERKQSKLSPEQLSWLIRLNNKGYLADVCYGADEAISLIERYLGEKVC